ncbi:hypothetical protein ACHAPA_000324 [Fusarium lateritium]
MAYQFEVGRPVSSTSASSASMISSTGYWNESRGGLQAGEQLWLALKQMELPYMNTPRHDFKMTKNISLRHLNVEAMLSLRELGKTTFNLPEMLFDLDCPGQYFRRIRSVAFSLYCVAGPYTNVSCNATPIDHRYRYDPGCTVGYGEKSSSSKPDPRFLGQTVKLPVSSVALSTGQLDAGEFELNFAGEEYQPFEGVEAISTWELRLPKTYTQFDYKTISDVIIHLRYTAKNGEDTLRSVVEESLDMSILWLQLCLGTPSKWGFR